MRKKKNDADKFGEGKRRKWVRHWTPPLPQQADIILHQTDIACFSPCQRSEADFWLFQSAKNEEGGGSRLCGLETWRWAFLLALAEAHILLLKILKQLGGISMEFFFSDPKIYGYGTWLQRPAVFLQGLAELEALLLCLAQRVPHSQPVSLLIIVTG